MAAPILCWVSLLAFLVSTVPSQSAEQAAKPVARSAVSPSYAAADDCEARMQTLDASQAEGEERLAEKNAVIDDCMRQFKNDKTVAALVRECAKYEEQPVIKQQIVAECQLAAFNYANALYSLKVEYGK